MIPISDEGGRIRRFPIVTILLIVLNAIVFLYQISLPSGQVEQFIMAYGVVPLEITTGRDLPPTIPYPIDVTLLTSMFMHGGWLHIIGNMLYLWVFGDNIEDTLGPVFYTVFYLVCGFAAAFAQIAADPVSRTPSIGASGAIAGVLGAYLLLHPTNRVNTLLIFGILIRTNQLPAFVVLGFWFVLQLVNGVTSLGVPNSSEVAYWAHIGGFVAGLVLMIPVAIFSGIRGSTRRGRFWQQQPRDFW